MRRSEGIAVAAIIAMTGPALLVFPALGVWSVMKVWPTMSGLDRALFCASFAALSAGLPLLVRNSLLRMKRGEPEGLAPIDIVIIGIPILIGGYALTHRWSIVLSMACWAMVSCYLSWKRKTAGSSHSAVNRTDP